jgi:hypothetical protein
MSHHMFASPHGPALPPHPGVLGSGVSLVHVQESPAFFAPPELAPPELVSLFDEQEMHAMMAMNAADERQ